jgi:hypothetical protein
LPARRFPPPWTAEVTPNCFIVRDANGQALSYIYYESEPGPRSAAKLLTKDEARRIAVKFALKPPGAIDHQFIGLGRSVKSTCPSDIPDVP